MLILKHSRKQPIELFLNFCLVRQKIVNVLIVIILYSVTAVYTQAVRTLI